MIDFRGILYDSEIFLASLAALREIKIDRFPHCPFEALRTLTIEL